MEQLHRPSVSEINQMNKETLKKTLKDVLKSLNADQHDNADALADDRDTVTMLQTILDEVKKLNAKNKNMNEEIQSMKNANKTLCESLEQQQRFLEVPDAEKRGCNLIITGVLETSDLNGNDGESANNDDDKITLILRKIGHDHVVPLHITRLGTPVPDKTRRPIKIIVASTQTRKNIINDTHKNETGRRCLQ